jgi:uncharacterized membrane protein
MITSKISITVPKPVGEAFSFLSDLENNPKWITGLISTTKLTEGPVQAGTRLRNKFKERGGIEYDETITSFDRNKSFSFDIHVPGMPISGHFDFISKGQETEIHFVENVKPEKFVYKLLAPLIKIQINKQLRKDFQTLAALLH